MPDRPTVLGFLHEMGAPAPAGVVAKEWVRQAKRTAAIKAEAVDSLLGDIRSILIQLQRASYRAFLERDDLEESAKWYEVRLEYLDRILQLIGDREFIDGEGI